MVILSDGVGGFVALGGGCVEKVTCSGGIVFSQEIRSGHALQVSQFLHVSVVGHVSSTVLAHSCFLHLNWMPHRPSRSSTKL